jgi:hypothetical protein
MEKNFQPAFPINYAVTPMGDVYNSYSDGLGGLSKREYAAIKILAGSCANPSPGDIPSMVRDSVYAADLLFAELEK